MTLDAAAVRETARGRWPGLILPALGIDVPNSPRTHAPCPVCGGKDRFRFDDRDGRGTHYCNQCEPQAGDGFALVMKVIGCTFPEALHRVAGVLGLDPTTQRGMHRPLPAPVIRIDRKALAFRYELAAIDRRLRSDSLLQAANRIDIAELSDEALDKVMQSVTAAYADRDRAALFESVADGLMARHDAERTGAR